ncbi:hypothetical protein [Terrabacter carboxydivorans]|uniref:Uncharacterized protein n=1 Tax=Terrabacter carboxydivorans TaxID=619730 RepID=A0ABN3KT80_9MICO
MTEQRSGGAHTSRTILLSDLSAVLASCDPRSSAADYRSAIIDENVAAKASVSSRQRTHRYLRELYALDPEVPAFRAMLRLWRRDRDGRRQIAMLMALVRDAALCATVPAILPIGEGAIVTSANLSRAVEAEHPGSYSPAIRDKIGRNALSSWAQAGYLHRAGRTVARHRVEPTAGAVAMALVLGSQQGVSGEGLFSTSVAGYLDAPGPLLHDRAHQASRKGWLEYRSRGHVTEIDLSALLAPLDSARLPIMEGDAR